jgi:amino acid adenylation domain-containing protein
MDMTNLAANPLAGAASLVEVVRRRAQEQPDRLAYRFLADGEVEEATFTYAELERRARTIAAWLQEHGAAGERILLLYPASLDYVAAFYGCLLAGAVAVPAYPPRPNRPMPRIRAIVADAQARIALTTTAVFSTLERRIADLPDLAAMTWRTTDDLPDAAAEAWRDPDADRDTLAFLQYTSGSTALPKGVMVTHGNLLHNESLIEAACGHTPETPCVSWLPLYHDLGLIGNMIQSLYVGTPCTLMAPVAFLQSPIRWLRAVSKYGGHTSGGPNFAYELCAAKTTPEQREGLDLSSWRVAFNGAEPVRQETLERFTQVFAPYGFRPEAFFPCYGLAETTLIVTGPAKELPHVHVPFRAEEMTRHRAVAAAGGEAGAREMVGCGRVLGDQEVAIVDPESRARCAADGVGEIWVSGPSIARGYWNRPEETAETFGAEIAGEGGRRYLRTGDLGFFHQGELYITGRRKDLIIIRGSNHYPQDVELTVERGHPALRPGGGAAFSVEVDGEERLVVVQEIQREQRRADLGEIAAAVRKAVADEHEVQLWALAVIKPGALPKTSSGKVQRRQTKADFLAGAFAERGELVGEWREGEKGGGAAGGAEEVPAELATRADVERWLTVRLAGLAGVGSAEIAAGQAISDYGLDSLKAIELMHGIEERTGVSLPMESFFGGLTLAEVVDRVAAERLAAPADAQPVWERLWEETEEAGDHPLSDGQKALWFLWQLEPESAAYNLTAAVRAGGLGAGTAPILAEAFQTLADRHPALRTSFGVGEDGEPVQRVHPVGTPVDFRAEDASAWSEEVLAAQLDEEAHRPFDLQSGPLLRVRLFERSGEAPVLLVALHHIVGDFWSLAILARELGALIVGTPLPPLELRYSDAVRAQRRMLAGPEGERLLAWWQERLGGELPILDLPTDRPRPPVQTYRGGAVRFVLGAEESARLRDLGRAHQATLFMTLLAGFQALLGRWSGQTDLLVGAPSAGRGRARLAGLVGYFVNPVVLRGDLSGAPAFAGFLDRVRGSVLGAFEHQDYPFPALVEHLQPERDPSRSPIFQVMFALQSAPSLQADGKDQSLAAFAVGDETAKVKVGPLSLRHVALPQRIAQFDLTLSMGEIGDAAEARLAGTLDFNLDLFEPGTAARLAGSLQALLAAAAADPGRPLADLPLLSAADQRQILVEWNTVEPGLPTAPPLVPALFAAQAAEVPEAAAVVRGGAPTTYRELAARSAALAAHLRALGVGPEMLVALCAERSLDLMVGIAGVLQAGAAYVPIDPESPADRRSFLLADAGASILLTQRRLDLSWPEGVQTVFLDDPAAGPGEIAPPAIHPESGACLIYTSGSTGEPKGVLLTHGNLAALVASFLASYAPGPGDAVLPLTSVASASFVGEVLPALASGAAVVLPDKGEMLDFTQLIGLIESAGVSILSTVPSMVAGLNALKDRLPKLRLLLSGGETLAAGDVDHLLDTAAVVNGYGLTETAVCSTIHRLEPADFTSGLPIPIGRPVMGHRLYILDEHLTPRPAGVPGELYIAGAGLARGYRGNPAATAERFLPDRFAETLGGRMYRTGDLARWRPDGVLDYLGRIDQQVKIRGFRIELGEIESVLGLHPAVRECAIVVRDESGEKRLAAYVVFAEGESAPAGELLAFLKEKLPDVMVPSAYVPLPALPLNANGKLDTAALPAPEPLRPELAAAFVAPRGEVERAVAEIWQEALKIEKVGVDDNFFDLGGHSLLMTRVHARLKEVVAPDLSLIDLFRYPTVRSLTRFLSPDREETKPQIAERRMRIETEDREIAVIGLGGRFPGAKNPDQLWRNLVGGVESISRFTDEQLLAAGVDPELIANPNYIKAKGILGDVDLFDAAFFGYNPRGAELTDPQHRVFLECAWEAMENAGYDTDRYAGRVGVFAGQSMNTYWLNNLYYHIDLVASVDSLQAAIGNDKDSLTTEVSYRMNLRGPSVLVQSSSSTSLTAIHYACQSLLAGECDMAISGGSSIHLPEVSGYLYHEGGTTDPDGHCRTFDAEAKGFVSGHGVGAVVLKRLADAQADGDRILAVIKGSACNNDGSHKVSYMAPSVDGHAEVVRAAQEAAGVAPDTISYFEAHGTGTLLGDPIEVAGVTQAFRAGTDKKQFCAIGSVKTNIGHLDTAAGVAGLMKTVLCLHHKTLPAILHFQRPNPKIDFANSPFFVNTELRPWEVPADFPAGTPRRAGVSSLGMGGTNTHVVLEEAPPSEPSGPSREWQLLPLSARTASALESQTLNLIAHLRESSDPLADMAWTLQAGRRELSHRRIVICRGAEEAVEVLESRDPERVIDGWAERGEKPVAFLFSGQGAQYVDMGLGLYATEEVFRAEVDRCAAILEPHLGFDLREVLYPGTGADPEEAAKRLQQTAVTQPALFVVEYALAKLWMSWGVRPQAMLGHSIGEWTAACLAGVFKLEDALALVAERGRLMQRMPPGSMLAVPLPEAEVTALLANHPEVSLATINRLDTCVVSGPPEAIAALEKELTAKELDIRPLHTSHAFHSAMMDPILAELAAAVAKVERRAPRIPYLSNVSGTWIRPEEATDPAYWARQLRTAVRFADGVAELLREPDRILLEVGPSNTLATAARQHPARTTSQAVVSSLRHPKEKHIDEAFLVTSLGKLWLAGVEIDFAAYHAGERRLRVALPTYPFERQRFWVEPKKPELARKRESTDLADWFHAPVWKQAPRAAMPAPEALSGGAGADWLLFQDSLGLGVALAARLRGLGARVTTVEAGASFTVRGPESYILDPKRDDGYDALLSELDADSRSPRRIVHLWNVFGETETADLDATLDRGFHSLLGLVRALARRGGEPAIDLLAVTSGVHEVTGEEDLHPERATLLGPCKVIPREMPNVTCRAVDVAGRLPRSEAALAALVDGLLAEATAGGNDFVLAYRGGRRWVQRFEPVRLEENTGKPRLRVGGVYLVTGGLGGIGLAVAEHLAERYRAKLILIGRSGLPERESWVAWLQANGDGDRRSRSIRKVHRLEELGGEVLALAADSADREALRRVKEQALERFGRIDGIFHAAGVPGMGLIQTKTRETAEAVLAPKVRGTLALAEVFGDPSPAFLALFSSVTGVLSQPAQSDYAAANAFLDAFAFAENARGGPFTVAVDWDAWQEVGMAVETEVPEALRAWRAESLRQGVSPAQGVAALERALRSTLPQLAVSRRDFQTRIEESYASRGLEELAAAEGGEVREAHARPALSSAFVPPRSETEQKIAAIWQEILGIDKVGIHDNFFDLGGNSLIGLKVISRVKAEFKAEVSAVTLFEGPTVSALAKLVQPPAEGEEERAPAFEDRRSRGAMRREKMRNRRA